MARQDLPGECYLLHHLLRKSALKYPAKDSVVSGNTKLTYAELDRQSDLLATRLRSMGASRGKTVGIMMPKSLSSVVSIFGVLKVGAAYVPLDPSAPAERLRHIVNDSEMKILLTSTDRTDFLYSTVGTFSDPPHVVPVDSARNTSNDASGTATLPTEAVHRDRVLNTGLGDGPADEGTEGDLAYIIYTSGSTGAPKGVMLSHRNSLSFVNWAKEKVRLTSRDRVSSHAPIHFDLSIFDIFSTIKAGATIVLVPEKASAFPVELVRLIEKAKISVWYSVPSVLTLMLLYGNLQGHPIPSLRAVIFAGEVFPTKYLRRLRGMLPGREFYNWYGPTETNVCTWYKVPQLEEGSDGPIPIGRACENTVVFVVDEKGALVTKPGVEGELWVRGPTVMLGYWKDKAKTSRVLTKSPFNPNYDELVYRTGDIVVMNEDGDYHYMGRKDGMVKTRGYRVELGEVEAAIYGHSGVKEVAVYPIPDEIVGSLIGAAVVQADGFKLSKDELLKFCSQRLPHYMLPARIDFLDALPRTSTGKTDRQALANGAPR